MTTRAEQIFLASYVAVTSAQVIVCLLADGWSADNVTRLAIIAFFAASFGWYWRTRHKPRSASAVVFVLRCSLNAMAVEGCYMISQPLFDSLRITRETALLDAVKYTLIDFAFTFPVYLVLFALVWRMVRRFQYRVAEYVVLFSLAQACGDGNAFFTANPAMLVFLPWLMLNYQACNLVPWLIARPHLAPQPAPLLVRVLVPLLAIPTAYWFLGAALHVIGKALGLRP